MLGFQPVKQDSKNTEVMAGEAGYGPVWRVFLGTSRWLHWGMFCFQHLFR